MTQSEKLTKLKTLLNITGPEQDSVLTVYLDLAKAEILSWMYSGAPPDGVVDVPVQCETTQIMAVVAGFSQSGAEGQLAHTENGIARHWRHEDMTAFVRSRVIPYAVVM